MAHKRRKLIPGDLIIASAASEFFLFIGHRGLKFSSGIVLNISRDGHIDIFDEVAAHVNGLARINFRHLKVPRKYDE